MNQINHSLFLNNILLAGDAGLEPTNVAVKVLCLTDLANPQHGERRRIRTFDTRLRRALLYPAELCTHINKCSWSGKRDSNSRLRPWQGRALPLNYSRKMYFVLICTLYGADEGSRTPTP